LPESSRRWPALCKSGNTGFGLLIKQVIPADGSEATGSTSIHSR